MRSTLLIPAAVLAFGVACSDTATSPTSVDRPLFLVTAGTFIDAGADAQTGVRTAGTPTGGHLQSGTINCVVAIDLSIRCSGGPAGTTYQINGVGNTNATATLSATYEATVDCTNKGGKLVPVKSQTTSAPASTGQLAPDNGKLTVPQLTAGVPSDASFEAQATCPNGNWTKEVSEGDPTLVTFTYRLDFVGFATPSVLITGS
jgi:hypothetical protein